MKVTLTGYEMLVAGNAGIMRETDHIRHGVTPNWNRGIEQAGAEMAVAKATGLFWVAATKEAEEEGSVQVRFPHQQSLCLVLRDSDTEYSLFIVVTGGMPSYVIHGAISGQDARQQFDGKVPLEKLRPLEDFTLQPVPMT